MAFSSVSTQYGWVAVAFIAPLFSGELHVYACVIVYKWFLILLQNEEVVDYYLDILGSVLVDAVSLN